MQELSPVQFRTLNVQRYLSKETKLSQIKQQCKSVRNSVLLITEDEQSYAYVVRPSSFIYRLQFRDWRLSMWISARG